MLGDPEVEGAAREFRAASTGEEEEELVSRSYQDTVFSDKIRKSVCQATDREGGGCLLPDDQCTKTGRLFVEVLQEKHTDM